MEEFWILILVALFVINFLEKAESVKLELKTFDEIFGEGWWDKDEAEDLKTPAPTNFGQNVHHQIDRQNTQIGQIEPNSTDHNPPLTEPDHSGQIEPNSTDQLGQIEPNSADQLGQIKPNSIDQLGQIEPNSTDQNPPHTDSNHSKNAKNEISSNKKRKIIDKFHEMKDEFTLKGKYSKKEWNQIEMKIAKHLKVSRLKIYKWKKEFGLSGKMHNFEKKKNKRKNLVEKFDQMKAELKRAGLKNSYQNEINETVAKELGLSFKTISNWKRELGQSTPQHKYSDSEQQKLMKHYYEIKDTNPKLSDGDIAKMLKIGSRTLVRWKKQFKRQQFHPNSVDVGHSVEENAGSNVQEIQNLNSESF